MSEAAGDVAADSGRQVVASEVGAVYREIDPSVIEPNPRQPRQVFDEEALAELVHSIREFGLMQPVVVRELPAVDGAPRHYQLVMGERRWRAAQQAGLPTIPAIVRIGPWSWMSFHCTTRSTAVVAMPSSASA